MDTQLVTQSLADSDELRQRGTSFDAGQVPRVRRTFARSSPNPNSRRLTHHEHKHSNPSVVLVHGGFVDGSGWQAVYDLLTRTGSTSASCRTRRCPSRATSRPPSR